MQDKKERESESLKKKRAKAKKSSTSTRAVTLLHIPLHDKVDNIRHSEVNEHVLTPQKHGRKILVQGSRERLHQSDNARAKN
jgi:hypothetical protein